MFLSENLYNLKKGVRSFLIIICFLLITLSDLFAFEIAVIKSKDIEPYNISLEGLKEVVKSDIQINDMKASLDNGLSIIKKIKKDKPDLILGLGAMAAFTASSNVTDIPVVYSMVSDPQRYNISGNNVTGVKLDIQLDRQFYFYRKIMPAIKKIGLIFHDDRLKILVNNAGLIVKKMGMELISEQISSQNDIPAAVDKMLSKVDAFWLVFDSVVTASPRIVQEVIILPALRKRIPVIGFNKWSVTAGALFSFYIEYRDIGRQTGIIVNRILHGIKPSSIFVQTPEKVRIFFNKKVIDRINSKVKLNIPDNAFIWKGD